jgi:hypothetical protein
MLDRVAHTGSQTLTFAVRYWGRTTGRRRLPGAGRCRWSKRRTLAGADGLSFRTLCRAGLLVDGFQAAPIQIGNRIALETPVQPVAASQNVGGAIAKDNLAENGVV